MKKRETKNKKRKYDECEVCKMAYPNKKLARDCEEWCRENRSCNLEIIKHRIK